MASVGMAPDRFPERTLPLTQGPLKLLYVGNVIALKGLDLALEALAASQTDAHLTLIGDGDFMEPARGMAQQLGLSSRVQFKGRLPQPATLAAYPDFDVFVFPSLHDTGGYAVLEAMANSLPVICLAVGGPAVMVNASAGFAIPLRARDIVVKELAEAIRAYDRNRSLLRDHAYGARQRVLQDFSWEQRAQNPFSLSQPSAFQLFLLLSRPANASAGATRRISRYLR
jgi:glycosyltransferase involved in cell wall biosynthesis